MFLENAGATSPSLSFLNCYRQVADLMGERGQLELWLFYRILLVCFLHRFPARFNC